MSNLTLASAVFFKNLFMYTGDDKEFPVLCLCSAITVCHLTLPPDTPGVGLGQMLRAGWNPVFQLFCSSLPLCTITHPLP